MSPPAEKRKAVVKGLAVVAPEVAVPLELASKAAAVAEKVLTGDLVVTRTLRNIGTKRNPVWQEREVHYNPISVGLGVIAAGVAAFIGVTAWEGRTGGAFFGPSPGYKDNYYRFLNDHPKFVAKLRLHGRP